jgi:L-rhamnose-H+ transport protein
LRQPSEGSNCLIFTLIKSGEAADYKNEDVKMNHAITMGIFWHLIGAASAACFYAPFKKVKHWSWETMWSVGGIVSWLILPWAISAMLLTRISGPTLLPSAPPPPAGVSVRAMWGIGNINYGLTMRYLGCRWVLASQLASR